MKTKTKLNKDPRIPHKFAPKILTKNYKWLQTMQQLHIYKWQNVKTFQTEQLKDLSLITFKHWFLRIAIIFLHMLERSKRIMWQIRNNVSLCYTKWRKKTILGIRKKTTFFKIQIQRCLHRRKKQDHSDNCTAYHYSLSSKLTGSLYRPKDG